MGKKISQQGQNSGKDIVRIYENGNLVLMYDKRRKILNEIKIIFRVETLAQAQSKARIKVCNYMVVATIIGCFTAVMLGKRQREEGLDMNDIMMGKNAPYK